MWASSVNHCVVFPSPPQMEQYPLNSPRVLVKVHSKAVSVKKFALQSKQSCSLLQLLSKTTIFCLNSLEDECARLHPIWNHLWTGVFCSELPAFTWLTPGAHCNNWCTLSMVTCGCFKGQTSIRFSVMEGPRCGYHSTDHTHSTLVYMCRVAGAQPETNVNIWSVMTQIAAYR